jgi:hypothetical protein
MNNEDINNLGDLSRLEKWRLILGEDADNDEDDLEEACDKPKYK